MSDQVDALKAKLLEAGIVPPADPPSIGVLSDDEDPSRPDLPKIQLPIDGSLLHKFGREIGAIVRGKGVFRWKDQVVTVDEKTGDRKDMDAHRFRSFVERYLVCVKLAFSKAGAFQVPQTMAVEHAQGCLRSDEFLDQQPVLVRVNRVRLPIMRADGSVELLPEGYDAESCIYTLHSGLVYQDMTLEEATTALRDFHREFPFGDRNAETGYSRSEAVHIANFVSQFGYMLLPPEARRLNFLYNANAPRSGKTLLVEIILNAVHGSANINNMPDDRKQLRDLLDTSVLCSSPYLFFDDLEGFVRNGLLNSFMTASTWSGRKFHTQDEFSGPKTPVIMLTGNNVEVAPDVAGRTLICTLFRLAADDQDQSIERPIDANHVKQAGVRSQLLSAMWTIVKAWRDGRPHAPGRMVRGYETWSSVFGAMVRFAGFGDPLEPDTDTDSFGNTEFQDMTLLVTHLAAGGTAEYEFRDLIMACRELTCFEPLMDGKLVWVSGEGDEKWQEFELTPKAKSRLGKLFGGRYGGQVFQTVHGRVKFGTRGKNRHKRYTVEVGR